MKQKNILVTGGAGFIGSFFCDLMLDHGHKIVCLDNLSYAGNMDNLSQAQQSPAFTFIKGDILDKELIPSLLADHQIDWVVNFAAESHVDNSIEGPEVFIETNIKGTYNLLNTSLHYYKSLNEAKKEAFKYCQISTDEVFGALGKTGEFNEQTAYAPNSPYSASKAGADHLVRAWFKTYGLPVITTNCSNNFGPRQHKEKFIPVIIQSCLDQKPIPVYGAGKNVRDWLYVKDHCRGIYLALQKGKLGEQYCLGGGTELSNIDLANKICALMDEHHSDLGNGESFNRLISFVDDRLGHDFRYAINCAKAEKELGYTPQDSLENKLLETINSYIKQ